MGNGSEKKQLGKILLKQKLVTQQELDAVLEEQAVAPHERLASTLKRSGKLSDQQLLRALSEQQGRPASVALKSIDDLSAPEEGS